ncbi:MAG: nucleotidyltransferase family protein [Bryobacteraceae bacterium]
MLRTLHEILTVLKAHEGDLQSRGIRHAAVFGSIARGAARPDSDIDVLVELDGQRPMGVFEYARIKIRIAEVLGGRVDVVNRTTLKPLLRESILRDCVHAF